MDNGGEGMAATDPLEGIDWTLDCQGKQDFDASVVRLSTRYWPRGGGFSIFDGRQWHENESRPEIKPSAKCSIMWRDDVLLEKEFEADTEAEVKAQVEAWARSVLEHLRAAVEAALVDAPGAP